MTKTAKTAKLWVNHISMTHNPADYVAYLTRPGHQLDAPDERSQIWTKSLPKVCKQDRTALLTQWRGIHDEFIKARQTSGSSIHHNAKITGRQFVINLPNDLSAEQVDHLAKAVLLDFRRHIPVTMVLHRKSNRGKQHLHLQGVFSYRNGGYGAIQDEFRMNITKNMKQTVAGEFVRFGYAVDYGKPGSINNKERQWLNRQGTIEQRRNPRFMETLAAQVTSRRLRAYCVKQAESMRSRMHQDQPTETTDMIMNIANHLSCIQDKSRSFRVQQAIPEADERGGRMPLTKEMLQKLLIEVRQWKRPIRINSKSI